MSGRRRRRKPTAKRLQTSAPDPRNPRGNTSTGALTVEEIAAELLISTTGVYKLIKAGELKEWRPSPGRVYVTVDDFSRYLSRKLGRKVTYAPPRQARPDGNGGEVTRE